MSTAHTRMAGMKVELARRRKLRTRNKPYYRLAHWLFLAPGPWVVDLFERGIDYRLLVWLAVADLPIGVFPAAGRDCGAGHAGASTPGDKLHEGRGSGTALLLRDSMGRFDRATCARRLLEGPASNAQRGLVETGALRRTSNVGGTMLQGWPSPTYSARDFR